MAITKPRNRVVLFRMTQEEYETLQQACAAQGARSVSDYARSRILGGEAPEPALARIESKIDTLARVVDRLSGASEGAIPKRVDAVATGFAAHVLANSGD